MYADYLTEPNLKIKTAARWSSSIPLFYQGARRFKLNKRGCKELSDIIADGGIGDNYPIHVLREQECEPRNILGFKLFNDGEPNKYNGVEEDSDNDTGNPKHIVDYGWRIVNFLRSQKNWPSPPIQQLTTV